MADALGTPNGVVSDEDFRLDLAGLIAGQSSSIAVRNGVMWGPGTQTIITGTSATGTMTVNVAACHWISTRASADGIYLGTKETTSTVNIAAAPGSNSRIDVVYAKQNDAGSTISPDGSTGELYSVVTGTAAASPVKPALPVGAVEIGTVTVAAGATSTAGAGVTINNTAPLVVARGADVPVRSQAERDALTTFPFLTVKRLDTGTIEARNAGNTAWVTIYDPTITNTWVDVVRSAGYNVTSLAGSFTNLTSLSSSVVVPAGRKLSVRATLPRVTANSNGEADLQLVMGGSVKDTGEIATGTVAIATQIKLEGQVTGTGASVSFSVQAKGVAGGGQVAAGTGSVVLQYRID